MSTRHQEPKKKKLKRSSMQDYAVVDSPYKAPQKDPFTRSTPECSVLDNSTPLRRKQKHGKPKSKKPAVRRRKNKNARDPFDCLVDDVVGVIVSFLPVQATETLRRVSKLWKATSEYHNDTRAIRRHFGHLGEGSKRFGNNEEANLHFRRLLYHQESLTAGFATRALQCSGTKFWHINNGTLIWASSGGSVSLRRLRSKESCQSVAEETHELDLHSIWPYMRRIMDCQVTETGEILALVNMYRTTANDIHTVLAKLSPGGTMIWQETFSWLSSGLKVRAAVGREAVYTIEGREGKQNAKSGEYAELVMQIW